MEHHLKFITIQQNVFVATFIGSPAMNLIEGVMKNNEITFKDGTKITVPDDFVVAREKFFKAEKEISASVLYTGGFHYY